MLYHTCPICKGHGVVIPSGTISGTIASNTEQCPTCQGIGILIKNEFCPTCGTNLRMERAIFEDDKLFTGHSCRGGEQ